MKIRNIQDIRTLTNQETAALEELISSVNDVFDVKNIILFGSKARGDSDLDSDVDVMVIIDDEETKEKRNKLSEISFEVNYKYDTNIYAGLGYSSK